MTLSRISPEKGIHLLLEALRGLETRPGFEGKDVCLFVCGEPAFMRGEAYARRVRRAAAKLERFRVFFPGYLSAFDKQVYFRLAELFVSPSLHESYGLTLVEAMRAGLPLLASDHYGVDETLDPSYGVKVPYRRASERAARLEEGLAGLLSDPDRLRSMGELARKAAGRMTFSGAARSLLDAALGMVEGS
jgi:glycosyltransferase involved in cell wall biosynthesis